MIEFWIAIKAINYSTSFWSFIEYSNWTIWFHLTTKLLQIAFSTKKKATEFLLFSPIHLIHSKRKKISAWIFSGANSSQREGNKPMSAKIATSISYHNTESLGLTEQPQRGVSPGKILMEITLLLSLFLLFSKILLFLFSLYIFFCFFLNRKQLFSSVANHWKVIECSWVRWWEKQEGCFFLYFCEMCAKKYYLNAIAWWSETLHVYRILLYGGEKKEL